LILLNEAIATLDKGMVLSLVMLDITAAFDVINHQLLLQKCQSLQIVNAALKWIERYLNNHTQFVLCNAHKSLPSRLTCGVPQGSILGPLLFLIFIGDITKVFSKHYVDYLLYADDIQLFTRSSIYNDVTTLLKKRNCLNVHSRIKMRLLNNEKNTLLPNYQKKRQFSNNECNINKTVVDLTLGAQAVNMNKLVPRRIT
jgi:hypothetical protein